VRDESSREGMRIVVEIKRGEKRSSFSTSFQVHADAGILRLILLSIVADSPATRPIPLIKLSSSSC